MANQVDHELAKLIRRFWLGRPDLHDRFRDPAETDSVEFDLWCLLHGRRDYRLLHHSALAERLGHVMGHEVDAWPDLALPLTATMEAIWCERPDIGEAFPLCNEQGRIGYINWFLAHGLAEYHLKPLLPVALRERLLSPDPRSASADHPEIPRLVRLAWDIREDLKGLFDLHDPQGRSRLLDWFWRSGLWEMGWHDLLPPRMQRVLDEPQPGMPEVLGRPITRRMHALWSARSELRKEFDLESADGRHAYLGWFLIIDPTGDPLARVTGADRCWLMESVELGEGETAQRWALVMWQCVSDLRDQYDIRAAAGVRALLEHLGSTDALAPDLRSLLTPPPASHARPPGRIGRKQGVIRIVGSAFGEHGIGEDVRTIARSLSAAGLPVAIHDTGSGALADGDDSVADLVDSLADGDASILVMTPQDAVQMAIQGRLDPFRDQPLVGAWPCELQEWPTWAGDILEVVDEIWASTRFSAEAFRCPDRVPVHHLPLAVTVPRFDHRPRAAFGLPEDRFLFSYVFDMHSNHHRKNPLAVVRAFRRAFPAGGEPVGLVVKVSNVRDDDPAWATVKEALAGDPRIVVRRERLDRAALLALLAACDSYVSLHRSEGFGRPIAEAMVLGKPVIATAYSGNMDFTGPDTACLVGYRQTAIGEGLFPYGAGQFWAEPDVDHASWWMCRLLTDDRLRLRLGTAGRLHVLTHHSSEAVGRRYRQRLLELGVIVA